MVLIIRLLSRLIQHSILLIVSCIVFVALGEFWIRLPVPRFETRGKGVESLPYYVTGRCGVFIENGENVYYTWGHRVDNNSLGFRDREVDIPKPVNTFRVVVVGDSASWGTGLPLSKRYTNIAEIELNKLLQEMGILDIKVEVLTFSRGGGHLGKYISFIKQHIDVEPDLVVIALVFNDMNRKGTADEGTRQRFKDTLIPKWIGPLERLNYFRLRFLQTKLSQQTVFTLLEELDIIPDVYEAVWKSGYDVKGKNWKSFLADMEMMHDLCTKATGRAPMLMYFMVPVSGGRVANYTMSGKQERMEQKMFNRIKPVAKQLGYVEIDLFPSFKNELDGKYIALNKNDSHPNELCQKIYARELTKCILEHVDFESLSTEMEKGNE